MTDASLPMNRFAEGDFRIGKVLSRALTVLSRNLVPFCLVTAIAAVPNVFVQAEQSSSSDSSRTAGLAFLAVILSIVLTALSEAIVLFGAFQDMRGRPVNLVESMKVGLRRFFPVLGVALGTALFTGLASMLLLIPGLIVYTMLYVAMPACIVEQLGPIKSMGRSAALTKGHRWRIFGLWFLVAIVTLIGSGMVQALASVIGMGPMMVLNIAWSTLSGAFTAVMVVVAYHDLRVAKEGVDTDQIASVFD